MSKKNKAQRFPTAVYLDKDLHAQAKVIFAQKKTNFSAEVNKWLAKLVKANTIDVPVDKVPEEEKITVTKVEINPLVSTKKPEQDWF